MLTQLYAHATVVSKQLKKMVFHTYDISAFFVDLEDVILDDSWRTDWSDVTPTTSGESDVITTPLEKECKHNKFPVILLKVMTCTHFNCDRTEFRPTHYSKIQDSYILLLMIMFNTS